MLPVIALNSHLPVDLVIPRPFCCVCMAFDRPIWGISVLVEAPL